MLQKSAFDLLKTGENVFLTGAAGCGKTHLLNRYIRHLRAHGAGVAVTASTGIAATHLGGMTIHSWSGLGVRDALDEEDLQAIAKKKPVRERVRKARVLIIDEISMLSAHTVTCIDQILRHLQGRPMPFGGVQVIFSGDFFQLPPVEGRLAFMAPVWVKAQFNCCYLDESHRHEDGDLSRLLGEIRAGEVSAACRSRLEEKLQAPRGADENALKLHTHNADVDAANARKLAELPAPTRRFEATVSGSKTIAASLKKSVLAPECLELKKDARVMFVKNNPEENYMNGTLGTVVDFTESRWPVVQTADRNRITARPADWSVLNEQGEMLASYTQIPLRLAWAITVHKSQGMTLDRATVDLSKTFEPGQGYVALSRVKTWGGLELSGCNRIALQVDSLALKADRRFRALSAQAEAGISARPAQDLKKAFDRHVVRCGGTLDPAKIKRNKEQAATAKLAPVKLGTYEQTRTLIEAGKGLAEIAEARGLTGGTIISHLGKLHKEDSKLDIARFKPPEEMVNAVCSAIAKCRKAASDDDRDAEGNLKLTPIYRELDGKYDYNEIKLARLFC